MTGNTTVQHRDTKKAEQTRKPAPLLFESGNRFRDYFSAL